MAQTIAIDFDGVIHNMLMVKYTVFIFSTRSPRQIREWLKLRIMEQGPGDNPHNPTDWSWPKYTFTCQIIPFWVKFWNKKNVLGITKRKLPAMIYIDDRGLCFRGDWTETLADISKFKTYQQ